MRLWQDCLLSDSLRAKASDQVANLIACLGEGRSGIDDIIRPPPLFSIGGLQMDNLAEFRRGHARPRQHALALFPGRSADDDDSGKLALSPPLEQQRNVQHDEGARPIPAQEARPHRMHGGMNDPFQRFQLLRMAEHRGAQLGPVDALQPGGAGKARLDRGDDAAGGAPPMTAAFLTFCA